MVGGLFPRESEHDIRKALRQAERSSRQPHILDIGSGSGVWYDRSSLVSVLTELTELNPGQSKWR